MHSLLLSSIGCLGLAITLAILSVFYNTIDQSRLYFGLWVLALLVSLALIFNVKIFSGFKELGLKQSLIAITGALIGNSGIAIGLRYDAYFWYGVLLAAIGGMIFIPIFYRQRSA